jgi:glycosyl transferase family 87
MPGVGKIAPPRRPVRLEPRQRIAGSMPAVAISAMLAPSALMVGGIARGGYGLWNDFASYWLAGKLVAAGHTPYDLAALVRLGADQGIAFQAGTGYSYPLPFAVAMAPLAAVPFVVAALTFTVLSLLVFGLAVAGWLRDPRVFRSRPIVTLLVAFAAGLYPPVSGSVFFGQANLLVVGALGLGVRAWAGSDATRGLTGGIWIGLGGIVKVAPLALAVTAAMAGRYRGLLGIGLGAGGAMLVAAALAPFGLASMDRLTQLGAPDPYWTNQSINGLVSRLTIDSDRTVALFRGVDPALLGGILLGIFAFATLLILARARRELAAWDGFALAVGLTLVAALAGAPKNSFWNHVPALIGAGLLVASAGSGRALDRMGRWLLVGWFGMALLQWRVDSLDSGGLRAFGPLSAVLSSAAVLGLLALWVALARQLLRQGRVPSE